MLYCNIIIASTIILSAISVNCEYIKEPIIGGAEPYGSHYSYQVAIVGKHNNSYTRYLACGGGILSDFIILGNAECFLTITDEFMKVRFYVIVGSINLKNDYKKAIDVEFIYTYTEKCLMRGHHVILLQLAKSLNLISNVHLRKLNLPDKDASYAIQANVAGYGFKAIEQRKNHVSGGRPRISGISNHKLTYLPILIVPHTICQFSYENYSKTRSLCGTANKRPDFGIRGLCTYDEGGPLVVGGDIVVGVAQKNRRDCDNTILGQLFYNVQYYLDFINGVLTGNWTEGTVMRPNRIHIFY